MVVAYPPEIERKLDNINPAMEISTTNKSKLFQLSLKYLLPNPIIFISASRIKINTKILFKRLVAFCTGSGFQYQDNIKTIVFKMMQE